MKLRFGRKEVWAIFIGTVLFVALTKIKIPFGFIPNTALHPRVALLVAVSTLFGPITGGAIGLIGHAIGDAIEGTISWSWVFAEGVLGVLIGWLVNKLKINKDSFTTKNIVLFNVVQIFANAVAWIVIAPMLDVLIFSKPAKIEFTQGFWAFLGNIIVAGVLCTLLAAGYSIIRFYSLSRKNDTGPQK